MIDKEIINDFKNHKIKIYVEEKRIIYKSNIDWLDSD